MQRLEYDNYGGPGVMHFGTFTLPAPRPGEVVVAVMATSINPMDWKIRSGEMKFITGSKFPRAMGTDFSGVVEAVGAKVTHLKPGDAVVGTVSMKRSGAFAPRLVTSQELVVRKPEGLSFAEAATLPIAATTAWQALIKAGHLQRGQRVFLNGASGAVGQAAIAIARDAGAEVVGRVRPQLVSEATSLGLGRALDYTRPVPNELDHSFDIVFDANGSLTALEGNRLVKRGGLVIDIVPGPAKFLRALVSRSRKVVIADVKANHLQEVVDLAAAGKLAIKIFKTIALDAVPEAMASLERGERMDGKVVIEL